MNGWSSRTDSGSTATAEPVDRRWFEEALRAQGFLVEAPGLEDDAWLAPPVVAPPVVEPPAVAPPTLVEPPTLFEPPTHVAQLGDDLDDEPLRVETDVAHAAYEAPEPAVVQDEPDAPTVTLTTPPPRGVVPVPSAVWPVMGQTPARVAAAPVVAPAVGSVAVATRQPVAPTTLAAGTPPVPTGALAARLSRGATRPLVESPATPARSVEAPLDAGVALEPAQAQAQEWVAPSVAVPEPAPAPPTYPWAQPEPQRDVAVASGIATAAVVDASTAEATARAEADLQARAIQSVVAEPAEETPVAASSVVAEPAEEKPVATPAVAVAVSAAATQPTVPFAPPMTGIAAVAPRPPAPAVSTTVDGGESDLWGLVSDPRKAARPAAGTKGKASSSRATSIVLTVIVAFVVVVLVLGFLYLLTELL